MQTWGPATRSSGFILLTIEDNRSRDVFAVDKDFFKAIKEVVSDLPDSIKSIVIPENSFDEFRVYTDKSFYIIFSLEAGVGDQLETLRIFLEDKSKLGVGSRRGEGPSGAGTPHKGGNSVDPGFAPQYVDLRIKGRVYYK